MQNFPQLKDNDPKQTTKERVFTADKLNVLDGPLKSPHFNPTDNHVFYLLKTRLEAKYPRNQRAKPNEDGSPGKVSKIPSVY